MTNPNTWTSNAMEVGVAAADPDIANENLEYIKYELDNMTTTDYVRNLIVKQDTDTDHDINFYSPNTNYNSMVLMRDSSYNTYMKKKVGTFELTKRVDSTWASGDDSGGLDDNDSLSSGLTLYGFRLGKTTNDSSVDYIFSSDKTGASALTDANVVAGGWDLISASPIFGGVLDASSNWIDFIAMEISGGDLYTIYKSSVLCLNNGGTANTRASLALTIPIGFALDVELVIGQNLASQITHINHPDCNEESPVPGTLGVGCISNYVQCSRIWAKTNTNGEISYKTNVTNYLDISVLGYKFIRRP